MVPVSACGSARTCSYLVMENKREPEGVGNSWDTNVDEDQHGEKKTDVLLSFGHDGWSKNRLALCCGRMEI